MRTNLIMHFHCSECGSLLEIAYPGDLPTKENNRFSIRKAGEPLNEDEPTGAEVRYVPAIHVRPCGVCIERKTGPANALMAAVKAMSQ